MIPVFRMYASDADADNAVKKLKDAGFPAERRDDCVVVEKFGEHIVHRDGTVEGEGSVARNIKKVVDDASLGDGN